MKLIRPSLFIVLFFLLLNFSPFFAFTTHATGGGIIFNEIMYDLPGLDDNHEWIEVWNNSTTAFDLSGWKFVDGNINNNHNISAYQGTVILSSNEYGILTSSGSVFLADHPSFTGTVLKTTFTSGLHNTGELIGLKDSSGVVIDSVTYSSSWGANGNGKTLERDDTGNFVESFINGGTPGYRNSVYNQNGNTNNSNVNDNTNTNGDNSNVNSGGGNVNDNNNQATTVVPGDIIINEIYPAPASNSNTNEWVELYNITDIPIDLSLLTIDDNTANPENLNGTIEPHSYAVLEPSPKGLNNDGDAVIIRTGSGGIVIDQVQYGNYNNTGMNAPKPSYNQSIGRYPNLTDTDNDSQDFKVFGIPTKGGENVVDNHPPSARIIVQYPYKTTGNAPFSLNLTGEESNDPDGDTLSFSWDYGDGYKDVNENPLIHKYVTPGNYTVVLTVTDSWGASSVANLFITVTASSSSSGTTSSPSCSAKDLSQAIYISEVLPNPVGTDTENEFIEIVNFDTRPINLCGWRLDDKEGGSTPYTIAYDLFIQPGEYKVFMAPEIKLVFNNDEDDARLFDPYGVIIDQVHYTNPPEGKSYARTKIITTGSIRRLFASLDLALGFDEGYTWTWQAPTPGEDNDKPVEFQGVVLNELFPNPEGLDTEGEFVELKNTLDHAISLAGWHLADSSGSKYLFHENAILEPEALMAVPYHETQITLNNNEETIGLYDKNGGLQDQVSYTDSMEGKSYSRFINNPLFPLDSTWEWSAPTEGKENEREALTVEVDPPGGEYQGAIMVTLTANKPHAKIFYSFSGDIPPDEQREYTSPIRLSTTTELWFFAFIDERQATKIQNVRYVITSDSLTATGAIIINELYPNPKGKDAFQEWIELYNRGDETVDISSWRLTNKYKKQVVLQAQSFITPTGFYVVEIDKPTFTLTNTNDTITLFDIEGKVIDRMIYNHVKTAQSLIRLEQDGMTLNISTPTDFPTKGAKNIDGLQAPGKKKYVAKTKKGVLAQAKSLSTPVSGTIAQEQSNGQEHQEPIITMGGFLPSDKQQTHDNIYAQYLVMGSTIFLVMFLSVLFIFRKKQP